MPITYWNNTADGAPLALLEPVALTLRVEPGLTPGCGRSAEIWTNMPSIVSPDVADGSAVSGHTKPPSACWHSEPGLPQPMIGGGTEIKVICIPLAIGPYEYTARIVSAGNEANMEWAGSYGANAMFSVVDPTRTSLAPTAAGFHFHGSSSSSNSSSSGLEAPSIGSATAPSLPSRVALASAFPKMYRLVLRRLASFRRVPSESDALAVYTLSLLLTELRLRGERLPVLLSLLEMCLRLPASSTAGALGHSTSVATNLGNASVTNASAATLPHHIVSGSLVPPVSSVHFSSRSHMTRMLRRWLGDAAAQRAAWALWGQPPPGLLHGSYSVLCTREELLRGLVPSPVAGSGSTMSSLLTALNISSAVAAAAATDARAWATRGAGGGMGGTSMSSSMYRAGSGVGVGGGSGSGVGSGIGVGGSSGLFQHTSSSVLLGTGSGFVYVLSPDRTDVYFRSVLRAVSEGDASLAPSATAVDMAAGAEAGTLLPLAHTPMGIPPNHDFLSRSCSYGGYASSTGGSSVGYTTPTGGASSGSDTERPRSARMPSFAEGRRGSSTALGGSGGPSTPPRALPLWRQSSAPTSTTGRVFDALALSFSGMSMSRAVSNASLGSMGLASGSTSGEFLIPAGGNTDSPMVATQLGGGSPCPATPGRAMAGGAQTGTGLSPSHVSSIRSGMHCFLATQRAMTVLLDLAMLPNPSSGIDATPSQRISQLASNSSSGGGGGGVAAGLTVPPFTDVTGGAVVAVDQLLLELLLNLIRYGAWQVVSPSLLESLLFFMQVPMETTQRSWLLQMLVAMFMPSTVCAVLPPACIHFISNLSQDVGTVGVPMFNSCGMLARPSSLSFMTSGSSSGGLQDAHPLLLPHPACSSAPLPPFGTGMFAHSASQRAGILSSPPSHVTDAEAMTMHRRAMTVPSYTEEAGEPVLSRDATSARLQMSRARRSVLTHVTVALLRRVRLTHMHMARTVPEEKEVPYFLTSSTPLPVDAGMPDDSLNPRKTGAAAGRGKGGADGAPGATAGGRAAGGDSPMPGSSASFPTALQSPRPSDAHDASTRAREALRVAVTPSALSSMSVRDDILGDALTLPRIGSAAALKALTYAANESLKGAAATSPRARTEDRFELPDAVFGDAQDAEQRADRDAGARTPGTEEAEDESENDEALADLWRLVSSHGSNVVPGVGSDLPQMGSLKDLATFVLQIVKDFPASAYDYEDRTTVAARVEAWREDLRKAIRQEYAPRLASARFAESRAARVHLSGYALTTVSALSANSSLPPAGGGGSERFVSASASVRGSSPLPDVAGGAGGHLSNATSSGDVGSAFTPVQGIGSGFASAKSLTSLSTSEGGAASGASSSVGFAKPSAPGGGAPLVRLPSPGQTPATTSPAMLSTSPHLSPLEPLHALGAVAAPAPGALLPPHGAGGNGGGGTLFSVPALPPLSVGVPRTSAAASTVAPTSATGAAGLLTPSWVRPMPVAHMNLPGVTGAHNLQVNTHADDFDFSYETDAAGQPSSRRSGGSGSVRHASSVSPSMRHMADGMLTPLAIRAPARGLKAPSDGSAAAGNRSPMDATSPALAGLMRAASASTRGALHSGGHTPPGSFSLYAQAGGEASAVVPASASSEHAACAPGVSAATGSSVGSSVASASVHPSRTSRASLPSVLTSGMGLASRLPHTASFAEDVTAYRAPSVTAPAGVFDVALGSMRATSESPTISVCGVGRQLAPPVAPLSTGSNGAGAVAVLAGVPSLSHMPLPLVPSPTDLSPDMEDGTPAVPPMSVASLEAEMNARLAEVEHLHAPPAIAAQRVGPVRMLSAFTHALIRLSSTTCGEYDALVRVAAGLASADEGVARYITWRVLDSWPRNDSDKEKALLGFICNALPVWVSGVPRPGGSVMDVDGEECGISLAEPRALVSRVIARLALCVRSAHSATANDAIMQCLPTAAATNRGRVSSSGLGAYLLTDARSLMVIARALEANAGVTHAHARASIRPLIVVGGASSISISPARRVPSIRPRVSSGRDRDVTSVDGSRSVSRSRLPRTGSASSMDSMASTDSVDSTFTATSSIAETDDLETRAMELELVTGGDAGRVAPGGSSASSATLLPDAGAPDGVRAASSFTSQAVSVASLLPPALRAPYCPNPAGGAALASGMTSVYASPALSVGTTPAAAAAEQRRHVRSLVLASLMLTDCVFMAVEAHTADAMRSEGRTTSQSPLPVSPAPPGSATAAVGPCQLGAVAAGGAAAGLAGVNAVAPPTLPALLRPESSQCYGLNSAPIKLPSPPTRRAFAYTGSGHWSNTVRYNSLVVLQHLDKSLKDRLMALHATPDMRNAGISVADIADRFSRRRQRAHKRALMSLQKGARDVAWAVRMVLCGYRLMSSSRRRRGSVRVLTSSTPGVLPDGGDTGGEGGTAAQTNSKPASRMYGRRRSVGSEASSSLLSTPSAGVASESSPDSDNAAAEASTAAAAAAAAAASSVSGAAAPAHPSSVSARSSEEPRSVVPMGEGAARGAADIPAHPDTAAVPPPNGSDANTLSPSVPTWMPRPAATRTAAEARVRAGARRARSRSRSTSRERGVATVQPPATPDANAQRGETTIATDMRAPDVATASVRPGGSSPATSASTSPSRLPDVGPNAARETGREMGRETACLPPYAGRTIPRTASARSLRAMAALSRIMNAGDEDGAMQFS